VVHKGCQRHETIHNSSRVGYLLRSYSKCDFSSHKQQQKLRMKYIKAHNLLGTKPSNRSNPRQAGRQVDNHAVQQHLEAAALVQPVLQHHEVDVPWQCVA